MRDVRFVKGGVARARDAQGPPPNPVRRRTASCRSRTKNGGAAVPRTDVMLAGNWKTNRMVAHYSAGCGPLNAGLSRGICDGAPGFRPAPSESLAGPHRDLGDIP